MKYRDPSTGQFNPLHVKVSDTLPIGFIGSYGGVTPPEGWLICDGSVVSRTAYSALFAAIGTTYGAGDGSTTFNLPDYRDRVPVGLDSNDSDFNVLGKKVGSKSQTPTINGHALTINEMPSHSHTGSTDYAGDHSHTTDFGVYNPSGTGWWAVGLLGADGNASKVTDYSRGTNTTGSHRHTFTTSSVGGSQAHTHTANAISTIQQSIVTNYIIKAYQVVAAPAKVTDLFPVGKVEIFFDNEDHSNYLGFTWERIAQGRTLIGIDSTDSDFDTIGEFGGSKSNTYNLQHKHTQGNTGSTTLTVNQIPSHTHSYYTSNSVSNAEGSFVMGNTNPFVPSGQYGYAIGSTGGGQGHTHTNPDTANALGSTSISTVQPYVVVAYWRRVS